MKITAYQETWPLKQVFRISYSKRYNAELVICEIAENGIFGYGESYPYAHYGESPESVIDQIAAEVDKLQHIKSSHDIAKILPAGAARAAFDLAYLDLQAKKNNLTIWEFLELAPPKPVLSAYTLCVADIKQVDLDSKKHKDKKIIKLKLTGDDLDAERIKTVRSNIPNAKIVIDANESWNEKQYLELIEVCKDCKVALIEQPFKAGADEFLAKIKHEIPICADESCHTIDDLEKLKNKYDFVNIKLEKTGGLTEALALKSQAQKMGFKIMVGCMVATSLSLRMAYYLAQNVDFVDIDGFALLASDRNPGLKFSNSTVSEG